MSGPLRILIVDDSPEDRELYRRLLAQDPGQEYELLEAELGEDGLEMARRERPDCLLLALEAEMEDGMVLIAESRCKYGTRMFWMQPYTVADRHVTWGEPVSGGWRDPGNEEMILDAGFAGRMAAATR